MKSPGVKERIITTASRLFYNQGYNQTGINQIIDEASVAKASMYQHFRSKEDLAVAYLQRRHRNWINRLQEFVSGEPSPRDQILRSFDFLDLWLKESGFRGCSFQNIITDLPNDHHKVRNQVQLHKNDIRSWLRASLNLDTDLHGEHADDLADQIMVLMEGAIILSQIQKNAWPVQAAKKTCVRLLN